MSFFALSLRFFCGMAIAGLTTACAISRRRPVRTTPKNGELLSAPEVSFHVNSPEGFSQGRDNYCVVGQDAAFVSCGGVERTYFMNAADTFADTFIGGITKKGSQTEFDALYFRRSAAPTSEQCYGPYGSNVPPGVADTHHDIASRMRKRFDRLTRSGSLIRSSFSLTPQDLNSALQAVTGQGRIDPAKTVVRYANHSNIDGDRTYAGRIDFENDGSFDAKFIVNEGFEPAMCYLPDALRAIRYYEETPKTKRANE